MKNIVKITSLVLSVVSFSACQSNDETEDITSSRELTFSSTVEPVVAATDDGTAKATTYSIGSEFFGPGSEIDLDITSSNPILPLHTFTYAYTAGNVFKGNPGYHFSLDDNYITQLTAVWPKRSIRNEGSITDQRELENFRAADWMTAVSNITGIMPTNKPVPLHFVRENSLLEFELAGQHTDGIDIKSLLIELYVDGKPTAFWAYCEDGPNAKLILDAGMGINSRDNYLIGRLTVSEGTEYTIIFPQTNIEFEAGKRYLVTLTSQGYNMYAFVHIGGWNMGENGIGIPFQQPTPDINGNFVIETPQQLIAMSYLIRHYTDGITFDWPSRTYIVADNFTITPELAAQYIPVPASLFTGQVLQSGAAIQSIEYGAGQTLQLFDNNN